MTAAPPRAELSELGWPLARMAEALAALAQHCRLPLRAASTPPAPPARTLRDPEALGSWTEAVAAWLGVEAEPVEAAYSDVEDMLRRAAPAVVRLPESDRILLVVSGRGGGLGVIAPDLRIRQVELAAVRAALCEKIEAPAIAEIDGWLADLGLPPARARRARAALVRERLGARRLGGVWLLRLPPGASFWAQVRQSRIPARLQVLVVAHLSQMCLGVGSWWMLGRGALLGRLETTWLVAWLLLLLTAIPLRLLSMWAQGQVAITAGQLVKKRLLAGALRVDPELLRRDGSGQLLGRVLDSSAIEQLALGSGFTALLALTELVIVLLVLGAGPGGGLHAAVLGVWVLLTLAIGWRSYRATLEWTECKGDLTSDLVEQMVGHRTRLAQQPPSRWHEGEDATLERYLLRSRAVDRQEVTLLVLSRAWLFVGLCGFAPSFVAGASQASLAVGLGGILLGAQALATLSSGMGQAAGALIVWKRVAPIFEAAARPRVVPSPTLALAPAEPGRRRGGARSALLDAADLVFSHEGRPEPVVKGASLRIEVGDRVLVEGPSGGGKSTLASLLAGLNQPSSGLLLLEGLDWHTLGADGWRRRVVAAPQYNDSHVLSETFAFNLLMGRRWPPAPGDMRDAAAICEELGLEPLIERMPAGLSQMVGESGWRLSHGERSRLFIARALLQGAGLVILDESFAALDPDTLEKCLRCVLARAPALLVIAHP